VAPKPVNKQERIDGSGKNSRPMLIIGSTKKKANRLGKKQIQHTGVSIAAETPNTGSATDNCNRQETKKGPRQQLTILQKKDTLSQYFNDTTTTYYIYAGGENLAKMDALSVKIIPITPG
jgi:hypothetical protein